jgi:hypothetical protein
MFDRVTLSQGLVVLGVVLLIGPALAPVQQYRVHDTGGGTTSDRAELEEQGFRIVAYENLSDRGKELYRKTLENGGRYTVPIGQGAPDFEYEGNRDEGGRSDVRGFGERPGMIVIERPPDADLPEADEPLRAAEDLQERREERRRERQAEREAGTATPTDGTVNETATPTPERPGPEELRRTITRYDVMETTTDNPPLPAPANLARLLPALAGILAIGVGGYRSSLP